MIEGARMNPMVKFQTEAWLGQAALVEGLQMDEVGFLEDNWLHRAGMIEGV